MNWQAVLYTAVLWALGHNLLRLIAGVLGSRRPGFGEYLRPLGLPLADWTTADFWIAASVIAVLLWLLRETVLALRGIPGRFGRTVGLGLPGNPGLAAAFAGLAAALLICALGFLIASMDGAYGWTLFLLAPVLAGYLPGHVYSTKHLLTLSTALLLACGALTLSGALLLAFAIEGVICLMMAAPLAFPLALLGGWVAYLFRGSRSARQPAVMLLLIALPPWTAGLEKALRPSAEIFTVSTSIDLPATPERVWSTILQPARLAEPEHWIFRAGVAYPRASHIAGAGPGATRYCDFSTGKLVEPVLVWEPFRRLRFTVTSNPIPMQEWTPYAQIHPPHLDGFLVSRQGEFLLTPIAGGTRLTATTWYQHNLYPAQYWRWWSDWIIHEVHGMVLADIRGRTP